jgi:hypothetical protein
VCFDPLFGLIHFFRIRCQPNFLWWPAEGHPDALPKDTDVADDGVNRVPNFVPNT